MPETPNKKTPITKRHYSRKHSRKHTHSNSGYRLYENDKKTRLLLLPDRHETATASIFFYFKVGSKDEGENVHGISHFIEHMLYKGSAKYKNYLDISKTFDANGISYNAFTSKDMTAYHYKFLSTPDNLELICKITADMLFSPLMRTSDITPERNVIIQELKDDEDDIDDYINNILEERLLSGHPLSRPIIGTIESLNGIGRAELVKYHETHYTPANLMIVISGNLPNKFMNCISRYFTGGFREISLNERRSVALIPYSDKHSSYTIDCLSKSLQQDYIHLIFKTRGYFDPHLLEYKMLANILGGNMSSRLFIEIREKLGLVYSISCDITYYEEVGYFDIITQNESKNTIKCIANILAQLVKIKKHGINELELKENKKNYCDIFRTNFDDIEYENEYYAKQIIFNKPFEPASERIRKINALTCADIQKAANELFDFNKIHIITFGENKKTGINHVLRKYL